MMKRLAILSVLLLVGSPAMAASKVTAIKPLGISVDHGVNLTLDAPASSVFIANPDIADVQVMSPTSIMIFGKRTGETSFIASDANGRPLEQRTVSVTQDLSNLRQELDIAIPGNKIHASALPNGLVLTGEAKDAATVADAYKMAQRYIPTGGDIINRIHVGGSNQIQIRVRFAEVQRNIDNSLGFNWNAISSSIGGMTVGLATGISGLKTGGNILGNRPNNSTLNTANDVIGASSGNITAVLDALAQDGLVTILAEPNLTALSGETANFLAGGEFPIPIPQGNNTISIEFKKYGISLAFTPTLIGENRVSLHVKPEVSELTTTGSITLDNISVPAILTRRAETTVEVASGQSFAIAGLLENSQSQTVNKFPGLGDLPILGALFRSNHFRNGQTELVIIITPYIVRPTSDQQLALPTDGLSVPTESERLIGLRYSSGDENAHTISGDPIAIRDNSRRVPKTPVSSAAPAPESAPVEPVTASAEPIANPIRLPLGKSVPSTISPEGTTASGSGGFILE